MVPLRDKNPIKITPYVTYTLIAINALFFLYELTLPPSQLEAFFEVFAIVPKEFTLSLQGQGSIDLIPEPLTLITSQFIHAGFLHVGFNMWFLWIFGNNIEEELGGGKFLLFYLGCGALAGLTQWFFSAQSDVPSLGASGAIAGVMGAYILKFPDVEILTVIPLGFFFPTFRIPAIWYLGFWFLQQAVSGFASLNASANIGMENGGVAYWAHAGGFIFGAVLGPLLGLLSDDDNDSSLL
ncbi:rhomboid family intramembrane serine protease [Spirulina sp. CS-785/01]|uniref:rhomboid family intramembrane serine protease n=1 Tax=Spirulina sp. CS-785/01 TaxID=3021716 RepID=UPI00232D6D88|nr:rhomboid family intramembrane serine protease [Spirulina sp. CS-785/01]MDB9311615.1 rhomboid family intramembrane serine protease [Spirulina sp. CS-785/01]